jgi:CDGSH-type Zn-finger protein
MPTFINEDREGHLRTVIALQPGERVKLCRCMKSKEFPFCDGVHKTLEGNPAGPVVVEVALPQEDSTG